MSELLFYQSLWSTEARIPGVPEASYAERFDRVKAAGFHGLSIDLGALPLDRAEETVGHFERTGLQGLVTAFPKSIEDIRPAIRFAKAVGAPFLIVVGMVMPVTVAGMIPVVRAWLAIAEAEGMPLHFETHRNSITNDLFSTLQLLDAIPEMTLSADLSHYVVDRELWLPLSPDAQSQFTRVLERSSSFQGRIATSQHIQVPIAFPQHKKWLALFEGWWTRGFAEWRLRHKADENVIFLCELGPPEYAITDANGLELSDRWAEAEVLKTMASRCWDASRGRTT